MLGAVFPELTLLLDTCRLGIPLSDDQATKLRPELARHTLPSRLALEITEPDLAIGFGRSQKDTPTILRHPREIEVRPSACLYRNGGAEIDLVRLEAIGAHILPPFDELRLPLLERPLQFRVLGKVDVVWNLLVELRHFKFSSSQTRVSLACRIR